VFCKRQGIHSQKNPLVRIFLATAWQQFFNQVCKRPEMNFNGAASPAGVGCQRTRESSRKTKRTKENEIMRNLCSELEPAIRSCGDLSLTG
jgi:hypothetical protein